MSISGVSSASFSYPTSASNSQRPKNPLSDLDNALQSGNLSDAQSAFATFQQGLQNSSNNPISSNKTLSSDVQSIQSALQSGDMSSAQQAFSKLTTDMRAARPHGGGHHHGGGMPPMPPSSSTDSTSSTSSTNSSTSSTSTTDSTSSTDPLSALISVLSQVVGGTVNQQA